MHQLSFVLVLSILFGCASKSGSDRAPSSTQQSEKRIFINDSAWKTRIPQWKDFYIKGLEEQKVKRPACSDAAEYRISELTSERSEIKKKGLKKWYTIISPIFSFFKSLFIYYTKQRGLEKYLRLLDEAKVIISGQEHLHETPKFDKFVKKILKKTIQDSISLKTYKKNSQGQYVEVKDSEEREVNIRQINKLLIAENLLKGDASSYFCSYDLAFDEKKEKVFDEVKILTKRALTGLFHSGVMKSNKFFTAAKKFQELHLYVKYIKKRKAVTSNPEGYFLHWKSVMFRSQKKKRLAYEKQIKVILVEAEDDLISSEFNKLLEKFNSEHWRKEGY